MSKKKTTVKKVESGTEFVTKRTQTVWNTEGGSIVSDGTTGQKKIQITSEGGGNINLNSKVNSEFAPNNKQTLVHGKKFETVAGDNYETTKGGREIRVEEDLTFITGSEKFFNEPVAEEWVEKNQEIAAAKAAPEYNYGAVGNNTETEYADGGTRDSESGAVEGGSYTPSDAHADIPALMESKAADIAATEAKMGVGGNIKMMTAKHMFINAGTKAVTFDSGVMVPNARKVVKQYEVDGGECKPVYTAVSTYESKDTSGSVPFGDVHVSAASKFRVVTGSGGVSIKSAGEVNINSTGRLMLGGSEAAITGSNKSNTGRITMISDTDMFQEAGVIATRVAPNINDVASTQHTFKTPKAVFTGDLHIAGNVTVEGPDGIRVPAGDVVAGSVSLKNHTHGGVESGTSSTSAPNGSGSSSSSSGGGGSTGTAVNKIIAGTNVTISPSTGIGDVTINATGGGGSSDFSGDYNDLTNIPTTFNTVSSFSGSYNDLTDTPTPGLGSVAVLAAVAAAGYTTCDGTVTNVTTGPYLTGGGTTTPEIGIDSACAAKWDSASGGGIATVTAGTGLSGGGSGGGGGATVDIGVDAALVSYLDQSACPGINCIGTVVASDLTGFTCNNGTITTAGALLSGDATTIGVDSGALNYLNQSACQGLNCLGDITEVTTCGDYLTGGGLTGAINIGLKAACAVKWDNASAGGVTNVTGSGGICSTGGLTPDISIESSCVTKFDQSTCAGINCEGTITGVCGTAGLSGFASTGIATIGIDSGALTPFDQSACLGIDCVGSVTGSGTNNTIAAWSTSTGLTTSKLRQNFTKVIAGAALSATGGLETSGQILSSGVDLFSIFCDESGNNGTVVGSTAGALLSTNGSSTCTQFGINSGALDYLNQSACLGIDCLGTITGGGTNNYIAAYSTSTGITNSKLRQTFTDVVVGATLSATGDLRTSGQILSGGCDLNTLFGAGGVTSVSGVNGIESTGGNTPTLCVNSTVVRTTCDQVIGGTKHFTSPTNFLSVSATGLITGQCITTGAFMEANAASPELYSQGTVLALNEGGCVVESTEANSTMVFGVAAGDNKAPIVMGAEPVCVTGQIKVGDYITTSSCKGHGKKSTNPYPFGTIIAQAMESGEGDSYAIKAMIRKM